MTTCVRSSICRIHQVRSYGSNLAVNIWWKHYMTGDVDFERCNDPCDLDFTLAEAEFGGFGQIEMTPEDIRLVLKWDITKRYGRKTLDVFLN